MRKPELDRDYALIKVYKCWHCDYYAAFSMRMVEHIKRDHPETLR